MKGGNSIESDRRTNRGGKVGELIRKRKGMISFYDAIEDARGVAEFTDDDYDRVREKKYPWEK